MNLKHIKPFVLLLVLASCTPAVKESSSKPAIIGTWKLISGTVIKQGDTVVTDYTKGKSLIKIINDTHFAFLLHDLNGGKDSTNVFASGGGKYTLVDNKYTEHLEYCTDRQWEGNDFTFTVTIKGDTLIQEGREDIEAAGISQLNIEKYVRASGL